MGLAVAEEEHRLLMAWKRVVAVAVAPEAASAAPPVPAAPAGVAPAPPMPPISAAPVAAPPAAAVARTVVPTSEAAAEPEAAPPPMVKTEKRDQVIPRPEEGLVGIAVRRRLQDLDLTAAAEAAYI